MRSRTIEALALACLLFSTPSWALTGDRTQPIHIEADKVTIDDQKHVSTYEGDVRLTQGTTVVTADRITVYSNNNGPQRMVMTGNPATFRERLDQDDQIANGKALRIEHDTGSDVTLFIGDARFSRGKEEFTGDRIEYDARNDRVKAVGTPGSDHRVKIVILPKAKPPGKEANGATPPAGGKR